MGLKKIKRCNKCGVGTDFYKGKNICKDCNNKEYKQWAKSVSGRNKIRECNNRYYEKNKDTAEYRYLRLKTGAKQRNIYLEISKEEFIDIINSSCFYCGDEEKLGLDRVDSSVGYILDNVVPCCYRCNVAKNNMDIDEFLEHIKKIYEFNTSSIRDSKR